LEPLDPGAHARVAADDQDHGRLANAAKEFEAAIRASAVLNGYGVPGLDSRMLAVTYANLGVTYTQLGDAAKAADNGRKALDTNPQAVEQMLQQLSQAVAARPTAAGYVRLGLLLRLFGRVPEAQEAFGRAEQLDSILFGHSSEDRTATPPPVRR
jgi:tetratricopeptide (TPR) repeat protein